MTDETLVTFDTSPSALYTLWLAYINRKTKFVAEQPVPTIRVRRTHYHVRPDHLNAFHEICGVPRSETIHIIYPFTLVYPYIMRVLSRREMPFSMFITLNTRNSIVYHREITPNEIVNIDCYNRAPRVVPKGLETDIVSEVRAGDDTVWENTTTYLTRGTYGEARDAVVAPRLQPIDAAPVIDQWFLPAKDRFRFARVSGDTNGIHYIAPYARSLGFKRDFAQPIRVVARCVSALPDIERLAPARLDFFLKGQVYYQDNLVLKHLKIDSAHRFDLYCGGNPKPCISGILSAAQNREEALAQTADQLKKTSLSETTPVIP